MPEGDSYTRAAERLRPVLVDQVIRGVDGAPAVRKWASRLVGHPVTAIRTHGKHLLVDVRSGVSVHVWLGMSGRFEIRDHSGVTTALVDDRRPGERRRDDPGSIRLLLQTSRHDAICRSAPTVEVERTRVIDRRLERLGPDVLADAFDWETYRDQVARVAPGRMVADLLLDQRVLAGIGNEYKNEIMFLERLHPETPIGALDPTRIDGLVERARRLMAPNKNRSGRVTTGVRGRSLESWVFERTGRPCRRCRTAIVADHIGDPFPRVTYWCPTCQPKAPTP